MADTIANIGNQVSDVRTTFSSWDNCMSESYCKWPVIAAIIVASLIALSLIWCAARCLCCGLQCCCGCLSCCNACCPSPRGRRRDKGGYQQAPLTPYQQQYVPPQYTQPPPMHNPYLASGGASGFADSRKVATTATFESPSQKYNEDALPAMPSWSNASSRRVEQPPEEDDVELDKMDNKVVTSPVGQQPQNERLLDQNPNYYQDSRSTVNSGYHGQENGSTVDIGYMGAGHAHMNAQPYQDYDQQRRQMTSPYGGQQPASPYGNQAGATGFYTGGQTRNDSPSYGAPQNSYSNFSNNSYSPTGYDRNPTAPAAYRSPMSGGYHVSRENTTSPLANMPNENDFDSRTQARAPSYAQAKPYEINTSPPSYRSEVTSPVSTPGVLTPGGGGVVGRRPVQGSFQEI